MRIEWIEVENFKGFEKQRFEFDEHFTLIVGENGSGKTSAVLAISQFLDAWTRILTDSRQIDAPRVKEMLRVTSSILPSGAVGSYCVPLVLRGQVSHNGSSVLLSAEATSVQDIVMVTNTLANQLRKLVEPNGSAPQGFQIVYAVCALFAANRSFAAGDPNWQQIMAGNAFRNRGYDDWDNSRSPAIRLSEWMGRQEAIAFEEKQEASLYTAVKSAMTSALPGSRRVWFSAKYGEPVVEWENSVITAYSILSDGQKAILGLVGDIARRCALLNPHLEDRAPSETPGVVLIDEIDLHLHPRWQRRIMADLRRVFPKIQFIATTHSPIIISAAKDAKVIVLEEGGSRELSQAYGLDVNSVVEDLQGGEARDTQIKKLFAEANDLIEQGQMAKAREVSTRIRKELNGPDRDLVELDTMIENLEAFAHAPD